RSTTRSWSSATRTRPTASVPGWGRRWSTRWRRCWTPSPSSWRRWWLRPGEGSERQVPPEPRRGAGGGHSGLPGLGAGLAGPASEFRRTTRDTGTETTTQSRAISGRHDREPAIRFHGALYGVGQRLGEPERRRHPQPQTNEKTTPIPIRGNKL